MTSSKTGDMDIVQVIPAAFAEVKKKPVKIIKIC